MKRVLVFTSIAFASFQGAVAEVIENDTLRTLSLEEIVVNATKATKGVPMAYSNISKKEITKNNYGQDVPYLISQSPSVIVTSDAGTGIGYTNFRVRGTDANRINITVNGVPMNDSESHGVFWVNMSDFASSTENIQIQRGAGTSTNGAAAFGASIHLQTQAPNMLPYAEVSSTAGQFNTFKNTVKGGTGLLKDHFIFDARYSKTTSDGYIDRAKADMQSYFASGAYYSDNLMVKYQSFGSAEITNQAWWGVPSSMLDKSSVDYKKSNRTYNSCGEYVEDGITKYYDQTDNYWQYHHHLSSVYTINDNWNTNLTLHYTRGKGYYEDYKADASFYKYNLANFTDSEGKTVKNSDLVRQKWLNNHFYGAIYNLNYNTERMFATLGAGINNYNGYHTGKVIWAKNYNNLKSGHRYYLSHANKIDANVFARANYYFTKGLSGYADLQFRTIDYTIDGNSDRFNDNKEQAKLNVNEKFNFFNPKVGLNYSSNGHNAFASFSTANREPNRNNYTDSSEKEYPTYETLYDYELGYSYTNPFWNAGINLYYMDYNNQLIQTGKISDIGEPLTSNIKDSYRTGIEIMGGVRILPTLSWRGNVTFSSNKIKNFSEYVETFVGEDWDKAPITEVYIGKTDICFSPNTIVNSSFDFNYHGFYASFNSVYVSRQYLDNTSNKGRSIDPYFVNNLILGYTFKPRFVKEINLGLKINNIFNEEYETFGWVSTSINESQGYTLDKRSVYDGLFTQAGTNVLGSLTIKF
ncbi:MAG: TonB-dependent receptor [Bacteroidales bacterium]|nr:TonB-dependent receptor [Bacteroidales bacterium]